MQSKPKLEKHEIFQSALQSALQTKNYLTDNELIRVGVVV